MKQLYDVINEVTEKGNDLPIIYCDMDMVLCDFISGTEEVLGVPFPKADKTKRWPMKGFDSDDFSFSFLLLIFLI